MSFLCFPVYCLKFFSFSFFCGHLPENNRKADTKNWLSLRNYKLLAAFYPPQHRNSELFVLKTGKTNLKYFPKPHNFFKNLDLN